MSLNSAEIDLIISELDLEGSQIQKIIQPDFKSLIITLYKPGRKMDLLISLAQGETRLNITGKTFGKPEKQQRFAQFLKARITGGRINGISQPGKDRIIRIEIKNSDETTLLWTRLWSASANIIATDENMVILDLFYRRPARKETTGEILSLPEHVKSGAADSRPEAGKGYSVRDFSLPSGAEGDSIEYQDAPFNYFIDNCYTGHDQEAEKEHLREKISARIIKKISLLKGSLGRVTEELANTGSHEKLMQYGQLILSGKYQINPGDKWFKTDNYLDGGMAVSIELDATLTPEQNAENYFRKYKKAKASAINLSEEKNSLENRIKELSQSLTALESTDDTGVLKRILSGSELKKEKKTRETAPGLEFFSGSFRILVGRTAAENDELLRKHVRGNDYWLHARDYPGGYIFIKYENGKSVPLETLIEAANLAIHFSKGKNSGKGEVYYTQVKYLRRAKNAKTGTVLPTHEKNISVTLNDKILRKLLDKSSQGSLLF